MGFIFAIHVLPVIVFFASLMATLYYLGIMQRVVSFLGGLLHRLLKTSRTESMSAVANIFMGHTEAPLVVRPYLAATTNSELFAIMTVGMATIAGAVMAGFARWASSLKYLITASFMGAPGGLLMAKILVPETDYRDPQLVHVQYSDDVKPVNIFEAAANGARDGLDAGAQHRRDAARLHRLDRARQRDDRLDWAGSVGLEGLTFQAILGYVLAPLAFLLAGAVERGGRRR